jgi:hypothetical protein
VSERSVGLSPNKRGNVAGAIGRRRRPSPRPAGAVRTGFPAFALPAWAPGERLLGAALVLLLVAVVALLAPDNDPASSIGENGGSDDAPAVAAGAMLAAPEAPAAAAATDAPTTAPAAAAPTSAAAVDPDAGAAGSDEAAAPDGALLPAYRILTYYGHPHDPNMGIVGEYPKEQLLELLRAEAANYEAIDPSRPVLPAFELIATVAQRDPGADGTYILDTDLETLTEYVDFAEANDVLVFLDLQIGRGTVADEIAKVRPLLERPHVHLALDPEFAIAEGETPGIYIGELTAEEITYAQETLAELTAELGLPPKVLIVHQFVEDMIVGKDRIEPVPGVQLVLDADGYGAPSHKTEVYNILVRDEPIEFAGIKLFYKQDEPLMTPAEILALTPSPDLIIYQ